MTVFGIGIDIPGGLIAVAVRIAFDYFRQLVLCRFVICHKDKDIRGIYILHVGIDDPACPHQKGSTYKDQCGCDQCQDKEGDHIALLFSYIVFGDKEITVHPTTPYPAETP